MPLTGLDSATIATHNHGMVIPGRVKNGVGILEGGPPLPDGTIVSVSCDFPAKPRGERRVSFPLVRSKRPGTLHLTAERVAELLDEDDVSP